MKILKLSKRVWLIIAIGIFVIVGIAVGWVYFQQIGEQDELNKQLALLQSRLNVVQLAPLSSRQAELEEQLSQATPQLEAAKSLLSQPVGSVNVTGVLFDLARAYDVAVTEMTSPGPTTEDLEGVTCSVIPVKVKVEGKVPNLVGFITRLNSYFTTGVVKSVTITALETVSSDNVSTVLETTGSDNASANIQLAVYSYQGG